jgi:PKD domain
MEKKYFTFFIFFLFIVPSLTSAISINNDNDRLLNSSRTSFLRSHIAYAWATSENLNGFVEFYLDDPGNLSGVGNGSTVPNFFGGADFDFEGNLYGIDYAGGLYYIDVETGTMTFIGSSIGANDLCFDTSSSTWYVTSSNCLYIIDVNTGASTLVGSHGITNTMIDVTCDNDGNLYGYDVLWTGHSTLYSIDKSTGQATPIGDMGYGFVYAQDGAYDRDNGIFYVAGYFNDGTPSALLICDTQTGACTIVDYIQYGAMLNGFCIPFGSPDTSPTADFTFTPLNPLPGETVFFDASSSYDVNGYIILYQWDWESDGQYEDASPNPTMTHSWAYPGSYRVALRVTDNTSLTGRKTKTVNVINNPPSVPIISGPSNGTQYHESLFSLDSITDPEGDSLYCQWDWGDGNITDWSGPYPSGSQISIFHAWNMVGVYVMKARLKDTYGAMSNWSEGHSITVYENQPPEEPVIQGAVKGKPGVTYLYKIMTIDVENDNVYYYVDWGDNSSSGWFGPFNSSKYTSATHSWGQNGTYFIRVKAKDSWGAESEWGILSVKIPYRFNIPVVSFVEWLFIRFPHAFPILRYLFYKGGPGL